MPAAEPSLAERRRRVETQLHAQRETLALQLAPPALRAYPRSATMRLLLRRPVLVVGIVSVLAGALVAGRVRALSVVVRSLRALAVA